MGPSNRHRRSLGLVVMLCLAALGCSHTPVGPPPVPAELHGTLGTVEVVSDPHRPIIDLRPPAKTPGEGARTGVAIATGDTIVVGSAERGSRLGDALSQCGQTGQGVLLCTLGLSSFLVTSAAVGGVVGAVLAEPAARVEEAEASLEGAVVPMELRERLRHAVVQTLGQRTPVSLDSRPQPDPPTGGGPRRLWSRSERPMDATLTLRVRYVGLVGRGVNPRLTLLMTVGATLLRPGDGTVLYAHTFEYRSQEERVFTAWGANRAQVFREEMARASETLAQQIVTHLVGPGPSSATGAESANP